MLAAGGVSSGAIALEPRQQDKDFPAPTKRQPPANPRFSLLYRDCRYVVVDKPADVRMDGDFEHTVENFVLSVLRDDPRFDKKVRLVHRLDYATSGVVLCALTKAAAGIACTQFETRTVSKKYVALVHGRVDPARGDWQWPVADGAGFLMEVGTEANPGRSARSCCEVLAHGSFHGAVVTKVRLTPETGRRHQLRIHALAAGHPIVGDATYCGGERLQLEAGGLVIAPRMMLHAMQLEIALPPPDVRVYGRKSGRHLVTPRSFIADDPFTPDALPGLDLAPKQTAPSLCTSGALERLPPSATLPR